MVTTQIINQLNFKYMYSLSHHSPFIAPSTLPLMLVDFRSWAGLPLKHKNRSTWTELDFLIYKNRWICTWRMRRSRFDHFFYYWDNASKHIFLFFLCSVSSAATRHRINLFSHLLSRIPCSKLSSRQILRRQRLFAPATGLTMTAPTTLKAMINGKYCISIQIVGLNIFNNSELTDGLKSGCHPREYNRAYRLPSFSVKQQALRKILVMQSNKHCIFAATQSNIVLRKYWNSRFIALFLHRRCPGWIFYTYFIQF